ncbi:MAG: hypothetical protein ACMUIM_08980 [bacterium]
MAKKNLIKGPRFFWFLVSLSYFLCLIPILFSPKEKFIGNALFFGIYLVIAIFIGWGVAIFMDIVDTKQAEEVRESFINFLIFSKKGFAIVTVLLVIGILGFWVLYFEPFTMRLKKPAIYLYPKEDSVIQVSLDVKGKIVKDIPPYRDGWKVFVNKEGLINNKYDYLFYEALLKDIPLPEKGWLVEYSDLESWFVHTLPLLGLNQKESSQFMAYWLNELPASNYYEIRLIDAGFLESHLKLIISPQPDTVIRLFFYFRPRKERYLFNTPEILTPERNGFTVVEWGGVFEK